MQLTTIVLITIAGFLMADVFRFVFGFHSFLKKQTRKWVGFDLDGTLATNIPGKFDPRVIGNPIPEMIARLRRATDEGKEVKIFTARVSTNGTIVSIYNAIVARRVIQKWCEKHIGNKLDIVSTKDFKMRLLYDDSVVQVKTDTGEIL